MRRLMVSMTTLVMTVALAGSAWAAAAPEGEAPMDPKARVAAVYRGIAEATQQAEDQDRLIAIMTTYLDDLMDYDAFAQRTLVHSWPNLTKAQRQLFMDRFKKLVVKVYAKRFKPKTAFEVAYREDTAVFIGEDKQKAKVLTTVKGKKVAADVDYYFTFGGSADPGRWFVTDFEIDTVSMALNWRRQFERIIKAKGFDTLIARIEKKVGTDRKVGTDDEG